MSEELQTIRDPNTGQLVNSTEQFEPAPDEEHPTVEDEQEKKP